MTTLSTGHVYQKKIESISFSDPSHLLKSISDFKAEKPSQLLLKCEKEYILKSLLSDNLLKTISTHTRWTFSIRIPSQVLLKSPSSDNLLKTISTHTGWISQSEYLLRSFSNGVHVLLLKSILDFKTETPSQLLLNC